MLVGEVDSCVGAILPDGPVGSVEVHSEPGRAEGMVLDGSQEGVGIGTVDVVYDFRVTLRGDSVAATVPVFNAGFKVGHCFDPFGVEYVYVGCAGIVERLW